jgi:hypothetical protein
MRLRLWIVLVFAATTLLADAETLLDFRASSDGAAQLGDSGSRRGRVPAGLVEDSAWADVTVAYSIETDPLGSGLEWLRARIDGIRRGHVQLKRAVELPSASGIYRLTLTAGSSTSSRLQISLGGQTPPYKTWWDHTLTLQPGRHTHTFDFELGNPPPSPALFLKLRQPGEVDIYAVTLVRRTREQLAAALATDAPPTLNAFPWPEFPLGLPEGWNLTQVPGPHPQSVRVATGLATPRSTHPLLVQAPAERAWRLSSAPFRIPSPVGVHNASAYVRASAPGRLALFCDGKELGGMAFEASTEPRRVEFPFAPEMLGRWHVLQWSGSGPAIIEAVQIASGSSAPAYAPARAASLALSAGRERGNVFMAGVDASPVIEYAVTGSAAGASLRVRVADFYGATRELPPILLDSPAALRGTLAVPPTDGRPYGSYRVEAELVRGDKALAFPAELVVHHVRQPHHWGRLAPESRFGNHFHPSPDHLHAAKAIGTNWNRFHGGNAGGTYWHGVEPRRGEWRWHDAYVDAYRDAHFSLVGVWFGTPGWARPHRPDGNAWLDNGWAPRDHAEFARYVAASLKHYGDKIDAWQIWNEPWGEFWFTEWRPELGSTKQWHPGDKPDADFAALSKIAWETARGIRPDLPVLGINGTIGERGKNWMARLLRLGAAETCNILTYHAYLGGDLPQIIDPGSGRQRELRNRVFEPIVRTPAAARLPVWLTEGNWLQREIDTGLHHHVVLGHATPLDQVRDNAILLPVYHAQMFVLGVEKVFTYALNGGPEYYRPTNPGQINWGALATHARQIHPSATAYSAMAWNLEGTDSAHRTQIDPRTVVFSFRQTLANQTVLVCLGDDFSAALPALTALPGVAVLDFLGNPAAPREGVKHRLLYVRSADSADTLLARLRAVLGAP